MRSRMIRIVGRGTESRTDFINRRQPPASKKGKQMEPETIKGLLIGAAVIIGVIVFIRSRKKGGGGGGGSGGGGGGSPPRQQH
jgi:hypothetical protein